MIGGLDVAQLCATVVVLCVITFILGAALSR